MKKIENFEVPVSADSLSDAEILATTALLIRGNYSKNRAYISFCMSNNYEKAMYVVGEAFHELDMPLSTIGSDSSSLRLYTWGNDFKRLLAKQQLLPCESHTWTDSLKIPTAWHSLLSDKRYLISNLVHDIAKPFNIPSIGPVLKLPDNNVLAKGLLQLLSPINPYLHIRYLGHKSSHPVLCGSNKFETGTVDYPDDISDLL